MKLEGLAQSTTHRFWWAWLPVDVRPVLWYPLPQVPSLAFPPSHCRFHTPPLMSASHTATSLPLRSFHSERINNWGGGAEYIYMYDFPPPCGPVSFIYEKYDSQRFHFSGRKAHIVIKKVTEVSQEHLIMFLAPGKLGLLFNPLLAAANRCLPSPLC